MALHLYRRHRRDCKGSHPEDSRSSEFEERKRGWTRCICPIVATGTLAGAFKRRPTGLADWADARALVTTWEAVGAWDRPSADATTLAPAIDAPVIEIPAIDVPLPAAGAPAPAPQDRRRATLVDAGKVFVMKRQGEGLAPSTISKYRTFIKQLIAFADRRGYVFMDQFNVDDVDVFYATWALSPRTKSKRLSTLRAFFRFCAARRWLIENPVSYDLKPPKGASRAANKAPFSDEEVERIIKACDGLRIEWENETGTGVWTGEDVKDLVWLMLYTGYRISDAAFFDMRRLDGNQVYIRAKKNGGEVFAYVPDWLRERLVKRARYWGQRPFIIGHSERLETLTNLWRRRITRAFERAGRFEEPPTPHRFRHTFARILLQRGVPVADVADLMGDDEETIRKHYARWAYCPKDDRTSLTRSAPPGPRRSRAPPPHRGAACPRR
jgi:integrase